MAGIVPVMIDYVSSSPLEPTRSRTKSLSSPRTDAPVQKTLNPELRALVESFGDQKIVAVVRGLPGSGKSNLAHQVGQVRGNGLVCSADAYFLNEVDGELTYQFDPTKMKEAHRHCAMMFEEALALNAPTIIVDNTNIRPKEFSEYIADAQARGYKTVVVGIQCRNDSDAKIFCERCVHGVPLAGILKMKADYTEEGSDLMIPPWTASGEDDTGTLPEYCNAVLVDPANEAATTTGEAADTPRNVKAGTEAGCEQKTNEGTRAPKNTQSKGKKKLKPLKFNAIKILNTLSYNPAMRRELIKADAVDALMAFVKDTLKDEATTGVRYTSLATNECLWALRAIVKMVGQEEESAITGELEQRGVRWLLHALFNSLEGKGFPLENSTPATAEKYLQDIACLAASEVNARLLVKLGGVEILARSVEGDWSEETQVYMNDNPVAHAKLLQHATGALSHLSYLPEAHDMIHSADGMMCILKELVAPGGDAVIAKRRATPRSKKQAPKLSKEDAVQFRKLQQDPDYLEPIKMAKKHTSLILFQLEDRAKRKAEAAAAAAAAAQLQSAVDSGADEEPGQVMLSYCWGQVDSSTGKFPVQEKVLRMKRALEDRGYQTWMDVENMAGSTLGAMADAVEESDAIMIVMTKLYKESDACRMEADYSFQLKKNIVCCKAEADYTPDGWLGMILGSRYAATV